MTLGLCWLSQNRIVSSLLSLVWIMQLLQLALVLAVAPAEALEGGFYPSSLPGRDLAALLFTTICGAGLLSAAGLATAVVRLRHPEENRSTPFRMLGLAWIATCCLAGVAGPLYEPVLVMLPVFGLFTMLPLFWLLLTEPARLGHRVRQDLRERRIPFAFLLAPSGGTAVAYTLFLWAFASLWSMASPVLTSALSKILPSVSDVFADPVTIRGFESASFILLAAVLYFPVAALFFPSLLRFFLKNPGQRLACCLLVPVALLLANLLPLFLQELFGPVVLVAIFGTFSVPYLAALEGGMNGSVVIPSLSVWLILSLSVSFPRTRTALLRIRDLGSEQP